MTVRRKRSRTRNLPTLHFHDEELVRNAESERRLTVGLLTFCIAFCALVFQIGFKEVWAYGKCNLSIGTNCSTIAFEP
jgi:hypothetical protein